MRATVSICLLTHNYGCYIRTALDSVLAQTFGDWELLISDDCSSDETPRIVQPYLSDPRVRYVRHTTNLRQGGNWAYAIKNTRADRIATLHADDWWTPDALEAANAAFDADATVDLICGRFFRVDQDGQLQNGGLMFPPRETSEVVAGGEAQYQRQAASFSCLPSASLINRAVLASAGLPRDDLNMLVDYEFFLRIVAAARKVAWLHAPLACYRIHANGATATTARNGQLIDELRRLPALSVRHPNATAATVRSVSHATARRLYSTGLEVAITEQGLHGGQLVREARHYDPWLIASPTYWIDMILTAAGQRGRKWLCRLHPARAVASAA